MVAGVRPETFSALMSAVSVSGSVPSTCASAWLPSLKVTRSVPPSPASSTTWLLVRIWPSELRMMPEPDPAPWAPLTSIFTTDGSTLAATASTLPFVAGAFGVSTTFAVVGVAALPEPEDEPSSCQAVYAAAPPTPAPPPTRREAATIDPAKTTRRLRLHSAASLAAEWPVRREQAARRTGATSAGSLAGAAGVEWCRRCRSQPSRCRPDL